MVAVITGVLSALALVAAVWANITASDAAAAAKKSAAAAEESNEIARQARAQALEISDVDWRIELAGGDILIRNVGQSTARAVAALVRVDGVRFDVDGGDVPSDECVTFDAGNVMQDKMQAWAGRMSSKSEIGYGTYGPPPRISVEARMTWQSASGAPNVRVVEPVSFRIGAK